MKKFTTVDEYSESFPKDVQKIIGQLRETIKKSAPGAEEQISYQMPAYKLKGKPLVYFAAWERHLGFYATPSGNDAFKKELSNYKSGKGSVQFPIDKPVPFGLIAKIVKFKVHEIMKKQEPAASEFPKISAPALRALDNARIKTLQDLSKWTEAELLELHGMGPSTIPLLKKALKAKGLAFK